MVSTPAGIGSHETLSIDVAALEDEENHIEALIDPNGSAIRFVELTSWGGDFDTCFLRFVEALGRDWATWQALVERDGAAATWPVEGLRLTRAGLPAPHAR